MAIKLIELATLMGLYKGDIDMGRFGDDSFRIGQLEDGTYTYTNLATGHTQAIWRVNLNKLFLQFFWLKHMPLRVLRLYDFPPEYNPPLMFKTRAEERQYEALHEDSRITYLRELYMFGGEDSEYVIMMLYHIARVWCYDHGIEYIDDERQLCQRDAYGAIIPDYSDEYVDYHLCQPHTDEF